MVESHPTRLLYFVSWGAEFAEFLVNPAARLVSAAVWAVQGGIFIAYLLKEKKKCPVSTENWIVFYKDSELGSCTGRKHSSGTLDLK